MFLVGGLRGEGFGDGGVWVDGLRDDSVVALRGDLRVGGGCSGFATGA